VALGGEFEPDGCGCQRLLWLYVPAPKVLPSGDWALATSAARLGRRKSNRSARTSTVASDNPAAAKSVQIILSVEFNTIRSLDVISGILTNSSTARGVIIAFLNDRPRQLHRRRFPSGNTGRN
jgi:hypothetical protein